MADKLEALLEEEYLQSQLKEMRCGGHKGRREGEECEFCKTPHVMTWELFNKIVKKCYIRKQRVRKAIDSRIAHHKQHQLTRDRFPGNSENELYDDMKQNGAMESLEILKQELGI